MNTPTIVGKFRIEIRDSKKKSRYPTEICFNGIFLLLQNFFFQNLFLSGSSRNLIKIISLFKRYLVVYFQYNL